MILGAVVGGLNGYWLVGSAWYFIDKAGYPFSWIIAPDAATELVSRLSNFCRTRYRNS